jgi:hypothetical protein
MLVEYKMGGYDPHTIDMINFYAIMRRCMLYAPLSPAWIVAVYRPVRIVAVWAMHQHRIVIMKLYDRESK